jgi:hypothetical protein
LFPTFKSRRSDNKPSSVGIVPERAFEFMSMDRMLVRSASCAGIEDSRWLEESANEVSAVSWPSSVGMDPKRAFSLSDKLESFVKSPRCVGIVPLR